MKKILLAFGLMSAGILSGQIRYHSEVFQQVKVTSDVTYATNIDFLKNSDFSNQMQVGADLMDLKTLTATSQPIPAKYYDPSNTTTVVKVSDVKMDIYEPMNDTITDRPVVIYIHTGNFLPAGLNGSPNGLKVDSSAIVMCTKLAKRGFVAISVDYRLGWNPLATGPTGPVVRRATLLNAVYRAVQDMKQNVRALKGEAAGANTYGIDTTKITLYGEGSGAYVALAYGTLDKDSEMEIPKFVYPGTTDSSYINQNLVGGIDGTGGLLNLYLSNGHSTDIHFICNAGGALADTSWLEAGDPPMVTVHTIRDPFAPIDNGIVIVPTTNEDVVEVQGPNLFMVKANKVGNNAPYQSFTYNDPYTMKARSRYGQTFQYRATIQTQMTINADAEGLMAILRPYKADLLKNEGAPWQWWNPNSPIATTVIDPGPPPVTIHQASLQSNPDMSSAKGRIYSDTILNYMVPRIMVGLQLPGFNQIGIEEMDIASKLALYPNPTSGALFIKTQDSDIEVTTIELMDITGKVISTYDVSNQDIQLDLAGYTAGVYFVKINSNQGSTVQKVLKH